MKKEILEKLFLRIGFGLVILGLLLNQWVVAALISPDGLPLSAKIFVWGEQFILLLIGGAFLWFRKDLNAITNLLLVIGVVFLFFIAAELLLRTQHYKVQKLKLFKDSPFQAGSYGLKPNLDLMTNIEGQEVHIQTNKFGMPWRDVEKGKEDGRQRVAIVGDSFAFGCWVKEFDDGMSAVFDKTIDTNRFEVLNFAVCGYGPGDIALQFSEEILPFSVDYILFFFWNGNDFGDAYSGVGRYAVVDGTIKWKNEGSNRVLMEFKEFLANLSLYKLLTYYTGLIQAKRDFSLNKPVTPAVMWSLKEDSPLRVEARKKTVEELEKIRQIALKNHVKFIIVSIPFEEQVYAPQLVYENYDFHLPQKYVEDFACENNVPYLDLLPFLRSYAVVHKDSIFLKNDVHFNQEGHRIAGEKIAEFFNEYAD